MGGARPGAGRPPRSLRSVVATRTGPNGEPVDVTVMDRVEETIRSGAFVKDAAARVGMNVTQLRQYQTHGVRLRIELGETRPNGNPRLLPEALTPHDRDCMELAARMDTAEAEARTALLAVGMQMARGGRDRVEVTVKLNAAGQEIERSERRLTTEPDTRMLQWLLSHRWKEDFGPRVEVTGAEGAPLVDAAPIAERLKEMLGGIAANRAASDRDAIEAELAAVANGNGNGHAPTVNGNGQH